MLKRILLPILALICFTPGLHARTIRRWSHETLEREADVVVIATVIGFKAWNGESGYEELDNGRITTFYIKHVAKGSVASRQLELVHYRSHVGRRYPSPGIKSHRTFIAHLADFDRPDPDLDSDPDNPSPRDFRLYLKRRTDGLYEPVSGQIDSVYSAEFLDPQGQEETHARPR